MEKSIRLEWRSPRNKFERDRYGVTYSTDGGAVCFINNRKNPLRSHEFSKTIIHELIHALFMVLRAAPKMSRRDEELICRTIEGALDGFLRFR